MRTNLINGYTRDWLSGMSDEDYRKTIEYALAVPDDFFHRLVELYAEENSSL